MTGLGDIFDLPVLITLAVLAAGGTVTSCSACSVRSQARAAA